MNRVIGYTRVSTRDQVDGNSLESQARAIRAYCELKNLELVEIYQDAGISGSIPLNLRPAGRKAVGALAGRQAETVVIGKLDRAFRSAADCLNTVEKWEIGNISLHIINLGGNSVDTKSPAGKFMLTVLAAAAEMERGITRERCNEGRAASRRAGRQIGGVPFGYDTTDTKLLVVNVDEVRAIELIIELNQQGFSHRKIASDLNRRQMKTKRGKEWTGVQVARILKKTA